MGAMIGYSTFPKGGLCSQLKRSIPAHCSLIISPFVRILFFHFALLQHDRLSDYPSVRHIPEWVPWLSYKPMIRLGYELGNQVLYPPIRFVKEGMVVTISIFSSTSSISQWYTKYVTAQWHSNPFACSRESSGGREPETKWA
jgi:hypothetical protein